MKVVESQVMGAKVWDVVDEMFDEVLESFNTREEAESWMADEQAAQSEAAYERMIEDGETFRGTEASSFLAERQAEIQRKFK